MGKTNVSYCFRDTESKTDYFFNEHLEEFYSKKFDSESLRPDLWRTLAPKDFMKKDFKIVFFILFDGEGKYIR